MNYHLYISYAQDDRNGALSWALTTYEGVKDNGIYIAPGSKRGDASRACYVGLTRALRRAAKQPGVVQLTVFMDRAVIDAVGFGLAGVEKPAHPELHEQAMRKFNRFDLYKLAAMSSDDDLQPVEVAVTDDAADELERLRTITGRIKLGYWQIAKPNKILR
ncbi:hypothetical protein HNR44_001547 [Geomicrobium halophilum]|uniref:Uncharacterized protein n=1 Tax=Geomicrobium halophilum TaxID=549000 RepID=A0A841Q1B8_9BACL|nr:hypothetical protein [Geomicrobium halophilum]MBB6449598.1 hypothetical protein [Geomicrobium halophilum]